MKKVLLLVVAVILFISEKTTAQSCVASEPTGLFLTDITACQATLHWKHVPYISYYRMRYKIKGTSVWTKIKPHVYDTLYTFSGLQPGISYILGVSSVCPDSKGTYKTKKATTLGCEVAQVTSVDVSDYQSASITWQTYCSASSNQIRFRPVTTSTWSYVSTGSTQSAELNSLTLNTSYVFQVTACADTTNHWSVLDTFKIGALPNILVIVIDDARYDSYSGNGGPEFLQTASIDRIANEGVNFKNSFATYSLCAPSRATMLTGLYPHNNGAYNNETSYTDGLPTTGSILHDRGYYTALLGKYLYPTLPNQPQPGWDFWMATDKWAKINPRYNYGGVEIHPKGHEMHILTDSAIHLWATRATTQPMFMNLCYLSPHAAWIPQAEDTGAFANDSLPFPSNFYKYSNNCPSFYSTLNSLVSYSDADSLKTDLEAYLEVVRGLDREIGRLLDTMQAMNKLDNTLVMFVSDNGFFFGEHKLKSKNLAQEESIRVPIYARYPKWFSPGTVNTNQLVTNLDIAPTILAAAGVPNTYNMVGFSLKDLYNGTKQRDAFYIELIQGSITNYPDFRAVRSKQYLYTHYFCTDSAEEFFDIVNDPKENTNLINDQAYQSLIAEFRIKLDSFKVLLNDTVPGGYFDCDMVVNPRVTVGEPIADPGTQLYPNPASDAVVISMDDAEGPVNVTIYSSDGQLVMHEKWNAENSKLQVMLDVSDFPEGLYLVNIKSGNSVELHKLIVTH
ncbi:MAG TPA: sulfatase-like hydrolase/transferase [Chitinophagales bacterium]|nr:sulfatase-like hydrolase/transferase [Chitinophagales bacterium]